MAAKLIAEDGNLKGLVLALDVGEQWVIGRDPDACQLLIEDPAASRRHIICRNTPEGIILENLSETNPVQVNGVELHEPYLLKNGDKVKIGSGSYRFHSDERPKLIEEILAQATREETPQEEAPMSESIEKEEGNMEQKNEINEFEIEQEKEEEFHETPQEDSAGSDDEPSHDSIYDEEGPEAKDFAQINFDMMETGRWLMKVVGGPNNGAEFSMQSGSTYLIGTDPNTCDIVFHDNSVSRQHARITVTEDEVVMIEDMKSRNGTFIDGQPLTEKKPLILNSLVTAGTTTFVVYDREGEMQTIISPLLPSIVKVLQTEEAKEISAPSSPIAPSPEELAASMAAMEKPKKETHALGAFLLISIIVGMFVVVGIGTTTLFKSEPVVNKEQVDITDTLKTALAPFPGIKYSFNKNTGRLLLVGHVLTTPEKNQLMYNLQGMSFIKNLDDSGVVIDEGVWREINQVLSRNPSWKGISIHSPTPGHFVLSGSLQTRKQSEQLWDYISTNFPYLDMLEKRIIVEEDVISNVVTSLQNHGFKDIAAQLNNGELTLSGNAPHVKMTDLTTLVGEFREIPGVRSVKSYVTESAAEQSILNISDRYEVSGVSQHGKANTSVVINGRILTRGDVIDGMTITSIQPHAIYLEKSGIKYRIDYSQ